MSSEKKQWRKPEVRRLVAGAAEGKLVSGTCDNSGQTCGGGNYKS
jgi:hypothetical protein